MSQTGKERNVSRGRWQKRRNPAQLSARLVIALFMVVIISSQVRTAAHCNYRCCCLCVQGAVGGEMWKVSEKEERCSECVHARVAHISPPTE